MPAGRGPGGKGDLPSAMEVKFCVGKNQYQKSSKICNNQIQIPRRRDITKNGHALRIHALRSSSILSMILVAGLEQPSPFITEADRHSLDEDQQPKRYPKSPPDFSQFQPIVPKTNILQRPNPSTCVTGFALDGMRASSRRKTHEFRLSWSDSAV